MGNLITTVKKFLGNKNTVTILAILAGIIVLWYFYNYRVNQAITTIKIPYAINTIDTTKKIESDNIGFKEITKTTTNDSDIITDVNYLEGKYVCTGTSVPANGFFYKSQVCEQNQISTSILDKLADGNGLFRLSVNNQTTYANSIGEGTRIDLYVFITTSTGENMYGRLIESIEVLEVRDSSGKNVFWDSEAGDSAELLFGVPEEYRNLLEIASHLSGVTIVPVPRSSSYTQKPGETQIDSEVLSSYIMHQYDIYVDE